MSGGIIKVTASQRRQYLESNNRQPFRDVLDDLLEAEPELEALQKWATKSPDRWAQAIAIFARLGGFNDKLTIEDERKPQELSNAEIVMRLDELEGQIRGMGGAAKVIEAAEVTAAEVEEKERERKERRRLEKEKASEPLELEALELDVGED